MKNKNELRKIRRKNARLFPVYKMFAWDLIFFYSIEFLFYTITKKLTAPEVLFAGGFYLMFKMFCQVPAVTITEYIGQKKSIVLGNVFLIIYLLLLMFSPGMLGVVIANFFCAFGFDIKIIAEANILYDSVATKGGDGLYSTIDSKGGCGYYVLAGMGAFVSGYLFVINNYLPMILCLACVVIATLISLRFEDVHGINEAAKKSIENATYLKDLDQAFKFVFKSKRLKAFILFQIVFYSLLRIMITYQGDLLNSLGVPETEYSMIFAISILMGGFALSLKTTIEKKYKNRTLTFISLTFIAATIFTGVIVSLYPNKSIIPVVVLMYVVQQFGASIFYVLEQKYVRNFTSPKTRNKVAFVYESIGSIAASICSILGGVLLKFLSIQHAFLIVGLVSLILIIPILDYMRTRFGLKPNQYDKEDIDFDI